MKELYDKLRAYAPACEQEEADRALMLEWLEACPEKVFTRESRAAHFTGSGLVVSPELDWVLLIYHRIYDAWTWTGGHADGEPTCCVWRCGRRRRRPA